MDEKLKRDVADALLEAMTRQWPEVEDHLDHAFFDDELTLFFDGMAEAAIKVFQGRVTNAVADATLKVLQGRQTTSFKPCGNSTPVLDPNLTYTWNDFR